MQNLVKELEIAFDSIDRRRIKEVLLRIDRHITGNEAPTAKQLLKMDKQIVTELLTEAGSDKYVVIEFSDEKSRLLIGPGGLSFASLTYDSPEQAKRIFDIIR